MVASTSQACTSCSMMRADARQHLEGAAASSSSRRSAMAARSSCSISFIHSSLVWCWTMNSISSCVGRAAAAARSGSRRGAGSRRSSCDALKSSCAFSSATIFSGAHRLRAAQVTACFWLNSARCHSPLSSTCAQVLDRVPDVVEAGVQRREAEAQDVGHRRAVAGAEVADHAARDQRLHDGVGAARRARRQTCEPRARASRGVTSARPCPAQRASTSAMKRSVSASDLARSAAMPPSGSAAAQHVSSPHSSAVMREDRLRAAQVARDARRRAGSRRELEGRRVAPPARQRLPEARRRGAGAPRRRPARRGRR